MSISLVNECPICYCSDKLRELLIRTGHPIACRSRHDPVRPHREIVRWICDCCGFQAAPDAFAREILEAKAKQA
jgi:hypothetical protein